MDLNKAKKSRNLEDHTGYTQGQRWLDWFFTNLNPKYAYDKFKYGPEIRQKVKLDQAPQSKNFEDRTNLITPGVDWRTLMLVEAMRNQFKDGVRGDGSYTLEDPKRFRKPIFLKR